MSPNETNLEMANRHVAEQEARIEKQLGLLTWMEVRDLPTDEAETLLGEMVALLIDIQGHRDRLRPAASLAGLQN
jgi:hypothetical protein